MPEGARLARRHQQPFLLTLLHLQILLPRRAALAGTRVRAYHNLQIWGSTFLRLRFPSARRFQISQRCPSSVKVVLTESLETL